MRKRDVGAYRSHFHHNVSGGYQMACALSVPLSQRSKLCFDYRAAPFVHDLTANHVSTRLSDGDILKCLAIVSFDGLVDSVTRVTVTIRSHNSHRGFVSPRETHTRRG
jgi:hypothetical protein